MNQKIIDLYKKEREYQKKIFGEYAQNQTLNISSFIQFVETYLIKAKKSYSNKWDDELPPWLINCMEHHMEGTAPIDTYECLVKVFTLAGAALESYCEIDVDKWREDGVKSKWIKGENSNE